MCRQLWTQFRAADRVLHRRALGQEAHSPAAPARGLPRVPSAGLPSGSQLHREEVFERGHLEGWQVEQGQCKDADCLGVVCAFRPRHGASDPAVGSLLAELCARLRFCVSHDLLETGHLCMLARFKVNPWVSEENQPMTGEGYLHRVPCLTK